MTIIGNGSAQGVADETCAGMKACRKDAAIHDAQRAAALRELQQRHSIGQQAVDKVFGVAALAQQTDRVFTRAEVLLILKAIKADTGVVAGREALDRSIRTFTALE